MTALDLARRFRSQGFAVIPIPVGKKAPELAAWQRLVIPEPELSNYFNGKPSNIGLLLGEASDGLTDVDLDSSEARELADVFLPATTAIFGRASSPRSHWLYFAEPVIRPERFEDPTATNGRSMLVELRSTGQQTVAPGSVHPSGEAIDWSEGASLEPARVSAEDLAKGVRKLAAAALLLRQYPAEGGRHQLGLGLAGALIASEWSATDARTFILAVAKAAGDDEAHDRALAVDTTLRRIAAQEPIVGVGGLRDQLPADVLARVIDWLGLRFTPDHPYVERQDGLYLRTERGERRLTNFTARITKAIEEDDGAEIQHSVEVEATIGGRTRRVVMPVREFSSMNWPAERLGPGAIVSAGQGHRDHARAAIQYLSGQPPTHTVYTHTGWRRVGGRWVYLSAGGALDADGPVDGVAVRLPDRLASMALLAPPTGDDLVEAVRASLALLEVAPDPVTFPLLAGVYRAVLGATDFALGVVGESGQGKSELLTRAQQHFGAAFDRTRLPASFEDTANAVGAILFAAKDAFAVVDDFAPGGSTTDVQRLNREAGRLIRAQGNGAGRLRMRADSTLREAKDPRGLLAISGEDVPPGHSIRARMFVIQLPKGAVDWQRMTAAQADGARGLYAAAMAGFISWIAEDYEGWQSRLRDAQRQQRVFADKIVAHRRTPDVIASLTVGFMVFTAFAAHVGVLTAEARKALHGRAWAALTGGGAEQAAEQADQDPAQRFLALLRGAVASGAAHFAAAKDGGQPENPGAWGWQRRTYAGDTVWEPRGARVGWVDGADAYLEPEAAYEATRRAGAGLTISANTLRRRLSENGLLVTVDAGRQRTTVRKTVDGVRRDVLHLPSAAVVDVDQDETVPTVPGEIANRPTGGPVF